MSDLNFTAEEWAKGMGGAAPATTPTPPAEVPAPAADAAPAPEARADAVDAVPDTRPRNPDGTFAPRVDGQPSQSVEREPFEGFSKLPPEQQAAIRRLTGERDDFKLRYIREQGRNKGKLPQRQPGPARESQAGQRSPDSGATSVGQSATTARNAASGMQPGAQRDQVTRQIAAWEKHAADFPDDAKAIEERLGALKDTIEQGMLGSLTPHLRQMQQELAELREMRGEFESIRAERAERQWTETQNVFDTLAGDNWRQIAGFEDAEGRPVRGERQWHPDFVEWVENRDPDEAGYLWESLKHSSPRVVARIIADFNREKFPEAFGTSGTTTAATATPGSGSRDRRAEALRDVAPGSGTAKPTLPSQNGMGGDSEYAAAVRSNAYREWRERTG